MSSDSDSVESLDLGQTVGLLRSAGMEARMEHQTAKRFKLLYGISVGLGVALVASVLFWCLYFRGGFTWRSDPNLEFNWHPFLMVTSLIFLYSQSILVYRSGRNQLKKSLKLWHAIIHIGAFMLAVIGLQAAFDSHNLVTPPRPNLYTLHSWIGLITVILFAYQLLTGFVSFLYPTLSHSIRSALLPVHVSVGTATFVLALTAAMTGLQEKAIAALNWTNYSNRVPEAYMINFLGVMVIFFGVLVLYLVNDPTYKRTSLPEDEISLAHSDGAFNERIKSSKEKKP